MRHTSALQCKCYSCGGAFLVPTSCGFRCFLQTAKKMNAGSNWPVQTELGQDRLLYKYLHVSVNGTFKTPTDAHVLPHWPFQTFSNLQAKPMPKLCWGVLGYTFCHWGPLSWTHLEGSELIQSLCWWVVVTNHTNEADQDFIDCCKRLNEAQCRLNGFLGDWMTSQPLKTRQTRVENMLDLASKWLLA